MALKLRPSYYMNDDFRAPLPQCPYVGLNRSPGLRHPTSTAALEALPTTAHALRPVVSRRAGGALLGRPDHLPLFMTNGPPGPSGHLIAPLAAGRDPPTRHGEVGSHLI